MYILHTELSRMNEGTKCKPEHVKAVVEYTLDLMKEGLPVDICIQRLEPPFQYCYNTRPMNEMQLQILATFLYSQFSM